MIRLCADGMAGDPTAFERAWAARVDDFDACIAAHYLARVQPDARSARGRLGPGARRQLTAGDAPAAAAGNRP